MSKKNIKIEECCICRQKKELSFEHVPPQAAFNKQTVIHAKDFYSASNKRAYLSNPRGPQSQKGIGGHSLCKKCNPDTGGWYGAGYVDLAKLVNDELMRDPSSPIDISAEIYPLRILKQVITCFFSVNGPLSNYTKSDDLVDFVLDKNLQNFPIDKMRVYMFATRSGRSRANSFMYQSIPSSGKQSYFSEYVSAPLGFILTLNHLSPLEDGLYDISHFSQFRYDEKSKLDMTLTVKEIYSAFPGDYRTKQELERNFAKGELSKKSFRIQKEKEDYRQSATPKESAIRMFIPYLGPSGPVSGVYDKKPSDKTSLVQARDAKQGDFSNQYEYILFMGITTDVIEGHPFSVSHVGNIQENSQYLPLNIFSRGRETNSARGYALIRLIDKLNRNHEAIENVPVCVITNFDNEYIEEIASQRIPLYKDFYLPQNFKIINHTRIGDEALGYVLEESLEECVKQSKWIFEAFECKAGFPKSYHPETGEIMEMMQAEDVPIVDE